MAESNASKFAGKITSDGKIGQGGLAAGVGGTDWQSSIVTASTLTAVAGEGYFVNTTSSAITVTLPSSAVSGDTISIVDYAGTFASNNITLDANGLKIEGSTDNKILTTNKEGVTITYADATKGWIASSGVNSGNQALDPGPYAVDFLVVAGGGGGGSTYHGAGGGAGGYRTSTQSISVGTSITITVGDGGAGGVASNNLGTTGSTSSISGSGLTTITSAGGGGGGTETLFNGLNGGSGGGASKDGSIGSGNTPSVSPSQGNNGGTGNNSLPNYGSGGGGGASAVGANSTSTTGGNGGNGTASSITGSSVTYAGGGGGSTYDGGTPGTGGSGGGGNGSGGQGTAGTVNTGGGGGGSERSPISNGGAGGKGVVILSIPTAKYSGTITGSPTEATSGANKILTFTGSGSYTS